MKGIGELFEVRPGEEKSASLMVLHAFFMGLSTTFFETAVAALFLTRFQAEAIPLVYIGAAVISTLTGIVYSRLRDRVSFWTLMQTTLVFLLVTVLAIRAGLEISSAAWLIFGAFLWYRIVSILTDLEYWAVAARLYDVRQSKRLFGLIGSGEVVARTLGSFSIPLLVAAIAVQNLIVLSAAALLVSLILVGAVRRGAPAPEPGEGGGERPAVQAGARLGRLLANPYVSTIFLLTALGILGKYFVDFAFLQQTQTRFQDLARLAGFFGIFSGVTQALNLALRVFVSGRVLGRWGVKAGVLVLPASHVICTVLILLAGFRGEAAAALVFWLVIANQGIYKTMKHPFDNPSLKVLYQPLSREDRLTVQILNEAVLSPITIGVAGAVMLLFTRAVAYDPRTFAWIMLATFAAWIVVAVRAFRGYAGELARALRARIVDSVTFTVDDETSIAIVRSKLESESPADVIFCLSLLEKIEHKSLAASLIRFVDHPSADVRRHAVLAAGRLRAVPALAAVERRAADKDETIAVRAAAIRSLAALGDESRVRQIAEYLNHANAELRRAAMIGLLLRGDPRYVAIARERISTAVRSMNPADRIFAAGVVREAALPDLALVALRLLNDEDLDVRRAALEACAGLRDPDVLEVAVESFAEPALSSAASRILAGAGDVVVPLLERAYDRHPARSTRLRLVRSLGRIGGDRAAAALRRWIDCGDEILRTQVLQSLSMCGWRAAGEDAPFVEERIVRESAHAASKVAILASLASAPELDLLRSSLEDELRFCRRRLFLLLSFLGDAKTLLSARDTYFSDVGERRAYAIEMLDVTMNDRLRACVLPLLEDLPLAVRIERLEKLFPLPRRTAVEHLRALLTGDGAPASAWTRAVAARAVVTIPLPELVPLVRELARAEGAQPGREPADDVFREVARAGYADLAASAPGGAAMYSTIERVIILKGVPMFAGASEQVLAEIASVLEEVHFAPGEVVFHKGDIGCSMYIVIGGRARVHDGERTIVHLADRDVFGELAILDPEPRSADVTAVEATSLFRLERDAFLELMADHVEIVTGVLHVVCQRLRAATSGHRTDDRPPAPAVPPQPDEVLAPA